MMRAVLAAVAMAAVASSAFAFQEIPRESAKALGVTRGRPFTAGAVFISGKYIEPPYVVERWGTGIRINSKQVTGQVVDWSEFIKTQTGAKVTKTEVAPPPAAVSVPVAAVENDVDESSLDDLFDDDPKPKKKKPAVRRPVVSVPAKPRTLVSYSLDGDFVPNDATKALVGRINAARTEIDRILRSGGFLCFGDSYSRVAGDSRTMLQMLEVLPELLMRSTDLAEFQSSVRSANLVYLNEVLCEELFRNRVDYRKLQDLHAKLQRDQQLKKMLDDVSSPLF